MVSTVVEVEFLTEFGDLPLLQADTRYLGGSVTIREYVKGTRENAECSRLGNCNEDSGRCKCIEG